MFPLNISQLCAIVRGRPRGPHAPSTSIRSVTIDSRTDCRQAAFFALSGQRTHGIEFAIAAVDRGASVIVADVDEVSPDLPLVRVSDVELALADLAAANRVQSDALVAGVTGSVGKTTTKEAVAAVLRREFSGTCSPRSYNNHLGVPLSLLQIGMDDEFAVIEIGASQPGETAPLSALAAPEFGIVTRVAAAHLRGFHSLQDVQREKQQLVSALPRSGVAFLNADDPLVRGMADVARCRTVLFGLSDDADIKGRVVECSADRLVVLADGVRYSAELCGQHYATSLLAAIAVGRELGMSPHLIQDGLASLSPLEGRCRLLNVGSWRVIDDTYNANPESVKAALQVMNGLHGCHHRVLVLADMLDLGDQAEELHYGIGAAIAAAAIDHVAITGSFQNAVADGFLQNGGTLNRISVFQDQRQLCEMLPCLVSDGDAILVKGSRATQMERVVEHLKTLHRQSAGTGLRAA